MFGTGTVNPRYTGRIWFKLVIKFSDYSLFLVFLLKMWPKKSIFWATFFKRGPETDVDWPPLIWKNVVIQLENLNYFCKSNFIL